MTSPLILLTYARVSDRDRQGNNFSIPSQLEKMRAWGESEGWTTGYELSEKDSAYLEGLERAELNKALDLARERKIHGVMFFSPDRFTRDIGDGVILRRELRKHNVKLFCFTPQPHEITSDLEVLHILTDWQSQQYIERLREASMRGLQKKIELRIYPQGQAPYGYRVVGKKMETHLEVIEEEALVVIMIFAWYYSKNMGCQEIANILNEDRKPSNSSGKGILWTPQKVRHILNNEAYAGVWYANTWRRIGKKKKEKRPPEERTPIPIPPLSPITHAMWESVQEKLRTRQSGKRNETALISCRVRCVCGTAMSGVSVGNGITTRVYHYYRCTSHRTAGGFCGAKQWVAEDVDETIWRFAYELLHNPEKLLEGYRELQEKQAEDQAIYTHQIEVLEEQIAEQKRVLSEMIEQRNKTQSKSVQSILDAQIEAYGQALDALEVRRDALVRSQENTILTDEDIARIKEEVEAIRQMLEALHRIDEEADATAKRTLIEALNLRATLRTDEHGDRWVDIHWLRSVEPRPLCVPKNGKAGRSGRS